MAKTISVIIPVHDKASTLPLMIESLSYQLAAPDQFELIFVTDRCTDESPLIIEDFQRTTEIQVVKISCEEGSAARARNLGIKAATGEYYFFLDSDVIIPQDFFVKLIARLRSDHDAVFLVPIYGNSGSLSTWPFLVQDHDAWRTMNSAELLNWAATESSLADLRIGHASKTDGSLDHLYAPWVFCWSSAMAMSRELLAAVGGFNPSFSGKGSEDLELGYELHAFGSSFKMMLDTYALHLPHTRNRHSEEQIDRLQEREMLKRYPTRQMEALCAFDGAHANSMLELLEGIDIQTINHLTTSLNKYTHLEELNLPQMIELAIGTPPAWLMDLVGPDYVICPCIEHSEMHLPLFGFALPFEDGTFGAAIMIGLWQLFPERLACRLIEEALRVASVVYLIKDADLGNCLPLSPQQLSIHDAPYWERTYPLRRSFYDFKLTQCGREQTLSSFRVERSAGVAR